MRGARCNSYEVAQPNGTSTRSESACSVSLPVGEVVTQLILQGDGDKVPDSISKISSRPDFQALIYPGQSKNVKSMPIRLLHFWFVRSTIAPTLLKGWPMRIYSSKKAGVPAELHIYSEGGHGFGVRPRPLAVTTWPTGS